MTLAVADGGFDIAWPEDDAGESFGFQIAEVIEKKGWCVVETKAPKGLNEEAYKQATTTLRGFDALKEEFVADFQGKKSHGKVSFLDTDYDGVKDDALSMFDRDLTSLAAALVPVSAGAMGLPITDRYPGMVWVPYGSKKEERMFQAEALTEDDVEDGTIEKHVLFLMRRGLCFFNMIENEGGVLGLEPKEGSGKTAVSLPLKPNRVVIFKSGEFCINYAPTGKHLALTTWSLGPDPRSMIDMTKQIPVEDSKAASTVLGITGASFPLPTGDRVHVMELCCRFPGESIGGNRYWQMLLSGTDGFLPIPESRWDTSFWCTPNVEDRIPGKTYSRHGGFCADEHIYNFDADFFELKHDEAKFMAPAQKVALEDGYMCLANAGFNRDSLRNKPIGVFHGDTGSDWQAPLGENFDTQAETWMEAAVFPPTKDYTQRAGGISSVALTGTSNSVTCARLSHMFSLTGPVGTVDTACSSSLVASGIAMTFLRPREGGLDGPACNRYKMAVACGLATQIGPFSYIGMCALSMISPMGRCFTFDQSGDGYARGEGTGTIFLKASEDRDDILNQLGCLLGNSINQDGRSASMTAPNGPSQTACIQASMKESRVKASDIDVAECHGTGTALGDPIEVGALRNAMEPRATVLNTVSAKCHIGHLEGGAGIGGICKCLAMLAAACATPNVHLKEMNPNLSVAGFPLIFGTEANETGRNSCLTGVSSFGFGGTNGRSDLWGVTRISHNKAGEVDASKIGQLVVKCPVTAAPILLLSGEPADEGNTSKVKLADVLRDEFADYSISRQAYQGGYRYRAEELEEEEEVALKEDSLPHVCGSWDAFSEMQPMTLVAETKGTYEAVVRLGEVGYELFSICLDKKKSQSISPVLNNASPKIHAQGPADPTGNCWIIDGRDDQVKAGTAYKITLKLFKGRKEVSWAQTSDAPPSDMFEHGYAVAGSFTLGQPVSMTSTSKDTWTFEGKIGKQGKEDFYFLRDSDVNQAIYPSTCTDYSGAGNSLVLACGPDNLGQGKFWCIAGKVDEAFSLQLTVNDGGVKVTANKGTPVSWSTLSGYARHSYFVSGSFTDFRAEPMVLEQGSAGVFKITLPIADGNLVDSFRVLVDGDPQQAFAPEMDAEVAGAHIVIAPGSTQSKPGGKFIVRCPAGGGQISVTLDLKAVDRRRTVTWKLA